MSNEGIYTQLLFIYRTEKGRLKNENYYLLTIINSYLILKIKKYNNDRKRKHFTYPLDLLSVLFLKKDPTE